ncbi:uncharacterized protein [Drosophila pseudoobscura]|uniref:Uncharacterized protein isoform X1 n=1 Tax=Drosophila pseudoobscura pseudoobscura TaxID=46245 RepID=B5DJA0_DROPS|nr:uncharacterized protein LOC6903276 isoform X1 [Drosophila pseudoobscura]
MILMRICLLYLIFPLLLHAYPMAQHADPHNYPDLTDGLTDGDVQAALEDLSLEDLTSLDHLLDEHSHHDEDPNSGSDSDASQGNQFSEAKGTDEQVFEDLLASEDHFDDGCKDEDEEKKPNNLCTERPPVPKFTRSTTKTAATTCEPPDTTSGLPYKKTSSKKTPDYDNMGAPFGMSKCLKTKQMKCKPKPTIKSDEECEADDFECLRRFRERDSAKVFKQSPLDYDEENSDDSSVYVPANELARIGQLDEETLIHSLDREPMEDRVKQSGWKPLADEQEERAKLERTETYERHHLSRMAHRERKYAKAQEQKQIPYDPMDERPQLSAADSFLASNERDPMRFLAQMEDGNIDSQNDHREDRSQNENLTLEKLTEEQGQDPNEYLDFRRMKRENKQTDDAPDNSKETYLKQLMDSFPRDQDGQSNDDLEALQESVSAHLRVKRC